MSSSSKPAAAAPASGPVVEFGGALAVSWVMPNGLRVIHRETAGRGITAATILIRGGVLEEAPEKAGVANLVADTLLKGAAGKSATEIALSLDRLGASAEFGATSDYLDGSLVALGPRFADAWRIFAMSLVRPTFPIDQVEKERQNTLSEIEAVEDHIFDASSRELNRRLYGAHPYSRLVSGESSTVESLKREDLTAYHQRVCIPRNAVLAIVGPIRREELQALLDSTLSEWTSTAPAHPQEFGVAVRVGQEVIHLQKKFQQGYLMIATLAPSVSSPDAPALKLASAVLGGGMSSRLFMTLREQYGLGYELAALYPSKVETSKFVSYIGVDPAQLDAAYRLMMQQIETLRQDPVSKDELVAAKAYVRGGYLLDHQTAERQSWYLAWWQLMGRGFEFDSRYLDELQRVTPEDVLRVAKEHLDPSRALVLFVHPQEGKVPAKIP